MKRGIKGWALAAAAVLVMTLWCVPASAAGTWAVVSGTAYLNVRQQPSSTSAWRGSAARDSWVEILSSAGNNWYYCRVVSSNVYGYMSGNYLKTASQSSGGTGSGTGTVYNPGSYVNLRSYPSYDGAVVGQIPSGSTVRIMANEKGWYYVQMNGVYGYMRQEFILTDGSGGESVAWVNTANHGKLNMRTAPSASATVRGSYAWGTQVTVLLKGNTFWMVKVNGVTGFMNSSYLSSGGSGPVPTYVPWPTAAPWPTAMPWPTVMPGYGYALVKTIYSTQNPGYTVKLNLRMSPSSSAKVLAQLSAETRLDVMQQGLTWCKVFTNTGITGYVQTQYITLFNLPSTPTKQVVNGNTYVNLRSGAGSNYQVLRQVWSGSTVTVLTPGDVWTQVQYEGTTGYMMTRYLY